MNSNLTGPTQRALDRLKNVKRSGRGWTARCPCHADKENSLSINVGDDDCVLLKCHAGCGVEAIVAALDLKMKDLFTKKGGEGSFIPSDNTSTRQRLGCSLAQYAEAKRIPADFLTSVGLRDFNYLKHPAVRIPYFGTDGETAAVRVRIALTGDKFRWRTGDKPCLYGLWRLKKAEDEITLVEGESDSHTLWHHGIPALGLPGAGNWKEDRDADHLERFKTIYLVVEPDDGGEAVRKWLSTSKIRNRVKLVTLGEYKDVSGLYLNDPERFRECWQAAIKRAVPWIEQAAEEADARRREAWEKCEVLAQEPNILDRFAADLVRCGVVGEGRAGKLLYLAITTRLLGGEVFSISERPVSTVIKGPSSGGKSHVVKKVLGFFPKTAYYELTAMSDRNLAYSEEPIKHRFLVLYEAAGMQGDMNSYFLRSLLSEGRLRYEFVEKTSKGMKSRLIEREGPTGVIITTTEISLNPENETRLFSVPINDTPAQTQNVLDAVAAESTGITADKHEGIDLSPWHALQTWIESGDYRAAIPYATTLSDLMPPIAVRLRRDLGAVLNLIKAHALLNQSNRERDDTGNVVATLDGDYAVVHGLVADLVAEGVESTVSPAIRETVEKVADLKSIDKEEVSQADLCRALKLDRSAISRRVNGAIHLGFLKNLEDRKGRAARLVLDDPLPENIEILPSVERVREALTCCRVVGGDKAPPSPSHSTASPPNKEEAPQDDETWEANI